MSTEAQILANPACHGAASGEAGSSLGPLHLSRTLYKSPIFFFLVISMKFFAPGCVHFSQDRIAENKGKVKGDKQL